MDWNMLSGMSSEQLLNLTPNQIKVLEMQLFLEIKIVEDRIKLLDSLKQGIATWGPKKE